MSLRTVFLLCFAVACLPAVGWSSWIAIQAQSDRANAASAVRKAEAMGDALQLIEALSLERGVLQERTLSDGPITGDLAETAARNDALLDRAQRSMRRAGLPDDAVTQSREILIKLRRLVAEAVVRPVTERDPGLAPAIMAQLYERLNAVQGAVARAEREAALADARVGALVAVGSLAVEMRAAAGWRSSNLTGWFGGRVLTPGQLDEAMYMTGQVQHAWDRLQRQVLIVGEPPRLAAAIAATHDGFFRLAEPRYREYLSIVRAGGARPESLLTWRRWTVEALGGTLLARNAAITEALDYGTALALRAKMHLAIAAASTLGLFALAAGALLVLMRRLVLPVQRLTAAVARLASGDVAAIVPERGRHDEIGAMAAAIEVFRENAVALRQTNMRFDAALSNMSQGLAMYDAEERLVVSNARLCEVEGLPPDSLRTGMTLRETLAIYASVGHFRGRTLDEVYAERRGLWAANRASISFDEARGDRLVSVSIRSPTDDGGCLFTIEDITERRRLDEALRQSRDSLTLATEAARIGIWDWDVPANKLVWDARMYELYGIREQDFSGAYDAWQAGLHPDDLARGDAAIAAAIDGVKDFNIEFRVLWPNGEVHNIEAHALVQRDVEGRAIRMIGVNWDITERERATETIRLQADQYATMLATTSDGFWLLDRNGRFLTVNDAYCRMTGYSREELLRLGIEDIEAVESAKATEHHMATLVETGFDRFESQHRRKDGAVIDVEGSVSLWRATGQCLCFARDITNRKRTEEHIARMARYDSLTGLANRRVFVDALEQAIARARRGATSFAVLYLDLDHFKDINDTLGHPIGDALLVRVAERLRANVREVDMVARFGGDEFAIILNDIAEPADAGVVSERILGAIGGPTLIQAEAATVAADVADKIVRAVTEPITIEANRIHSGASVGIALYGPGSSDAETMLSHADVALYQAKVEQRGTYRFFTDGMGVELRARVSMSTELRDAIASNQFFLMYQPQVDIDTGRILGLEALVRWRHPTLGVLGPGKFIPAAERHGLIVPLGRWVMDEACRQTKWWLDVGIAPPLIAINVSAIQFKMPLELERDIVAAVAEIGLPPQLLELELTESVLMEASRDHNDVLLRLREKGHRIAIDDFGSGYSSLDYLRRYPVDRIKIAQTFIADIGVESGNDAIVKAALSLARELNIEVVVEGVETVAQLDLLKAWGARIVQGFYFARPLPVPEVTALLRIGRIVSVQTELAGVSILTAARSE